MNASTAQNILDLWHNLQEQQAYADRWLGDPRIASNPSPFDSFHTTCVNMRRDNLTRSLLAAMPELAPLLRREIEASQPKVDRTESEKQLLRNAVS